MNLCNRRLGEGEFVSWQQLESGLFFAVKQILRPFSSCAMDPDIRSVFQPAIQKILSRLDVLEISTFEAIILNVFDVGLDLPFLM